MTLGKTPDEPRGFSCGSGEATVRAAPARTVKILEYCMLAIKRGNRAKLGL